MIQETVDRLIDGIEKRNRDAVVIYMNRLTLDLFSDELLALCGVAEPGGRARYRGTPIKVDVAMKDNEIRVVGI